MNIPLEWYTETGTDPLIKRRRYIQERRCARCGHHALANRYLCAACAETHAYCASCEAIVPSGDWRPNGGCRACRLARGQAWRDRRRGMSGAEAHRAAGARQAETARERVAEMARLRERGWTWAEIARRLGVAESSARSTYSRLSTKVRDDHRP